MASKVKLSAGTPFSCWWWITGIKTKDDGITIWVAEDVAPTAQEAEKIAMEYRLFFKDGDWVEMNKGGMKFGLVYGGCAMIYSRLNPNS